MKDELFQINGTPEKGESGGCGMTGKIVGLDFEDAKERKLPGIEFRECCNVLPVAVSELEGSDFLSVRGNHCRDADGAITMDNDI